MRLAPEDRIQTVNIGKVEISFRPDRSAIVQGSESAAVSVLLRMVPLGSPSPAAPADVVVLLDCSGTVRRFRVEKQDAGHWADLAREREELVVGESDGRTMYLLKGRTLEEVSEVGPSALSISSDAILKLAAGLRDCDTCSVVGFATQAEVVHDGRRAGHLAALREALEAVQRDASTLGDGTRMEEGVRLAADVLGADPNSKRTRRLVIITDGMVEDEAASLRELDRIRSLGAAVIAVGVGREFDEEFLTRIADWTGGTYHYAPAPEDIEGRLSDDFGAFGTIGGRQLRVAARGLSGAVVNSVSQLVPQMRMFEEIRLRDDWFEVNVGDISGTEGLSLLTEIALPWLPAGSHPVGEIQVRWRDPESDRTWESRYLVEMTCLPVDSAPPEADAEVEQLALRLQVYRSERAAQWAQDGGRPGVATVRLREASRILDQLGERELSQQIEQQAADIEGKSVDPNRTKTVKDWVRRLGRRNDDEG